MKKRIYTVKELKEILQSLPDYADVKKIEIDENITVGVNVIWSEGTSWLDPSICFEA